MKTFFVPLLCISFLVSCVSSLQIVETDDPYKGIKSARLHFAPKSYSEVKYDDELIRRVHYNVKSTYLYEAKGSDRPTVMVDFRVVVPLVTDSLDSVMFLNLDNEMIRLVSNQYQCKEFDSSTTTSVLATYQLMSREFVIPENLWISIANSETIKCRLYLGKTAIDVKMRGDEIKKLKYFFSLAVAKLETHFPAIPEGQKKW